MEIKKEENKNKPENLNNQSEEFQLQFMQPWIFPQNQQFPQFFPQDPEQQIFPQQIYQNFNNDQQQNYKKNQHKSPDKNKNSPKKKPIVKKKYKKEFPALEKTFSSYKKINKDKKPIIRKNEKKSKKKGKKKKHIGKTTIGRLDLEFINISQKVEELMKKTKGNFQMHDEAMFNKDVKFLIDDEGKKFNFRIRKDGELVVKYKKEKLSKIKKSQKEFNRLNKTVDEEDTEDKMEEIIEEETQEVSKFNISNLIPENFFEYSKKVELFFENKENRGSIPSDIRVRGYVDHIITAELEKLTLGFINQLKFSEILKKKKAPLKARRRIKSGFSEVQRSLKAPPGEKKCKLLIISFNVQENNLEEGTDEKITQIIKTAQENGVFYLFAGTRNELGMSLYGKILKRKAKSSAISIINYEGFKPTYKKILKLAQELRNKFKEKYAIFNNKEEENKVVIY